MLRLSQLFESHKREGADSNMEGSQNSLPPSPAPQSPQSTVSSNPASPVASLFSTRTHNRFPSSVSSLASSPGMGNSTEVCVTVKTHLTEVKEEPDAKLVEEDNYFLNFNDIHVVDQTESRVSFESHNYDLSDDLADAVRPSKKPRSSSTSIRGISRISSSLSSISSKWRQKQVTDTATVLDKYDESLLSRANSTTSIVANPMVGSWSGRQSINSTSPARTIFEERLSECNVQPLNIEKANRDSARDCEPQATTPLLPPVMMNLPTPENESLVNSPLQSPTVAEPVESTETKFLPCKQPPTGILSPPLSTRPSLSSISRQQGGSREYSTDQSRIMMANASDEWSCKLGHANFTIHPEPYLPEPCVIEAFEAHRTNWYHARCNYAKHLARTGEHYGATSHIYRLTEDKWESINNQWRANHNYVVENLTDGNGNPLSLSDSNVYPGEAVKIPPLHDKGKFPDLGDEDIVGPMSVAPVQLRSQSPEKSTRKRSFFKFLQDLFFYRGSPKA